MRHPPIGNRLMLSTPPAIMQSAIPLCTFAEAMAIVSSPDAQYLFTVIPGTLSVSKAISEIRRATFNPCSASGVALPTITSSICSFSTLGTDATRCLITSAANVSGRVNLKPPRVALPTALRLAATIYAFMVNFFFNFLKFFRLSGLIVSSPAFCVRYKGKGTPPVQALTGILRSPASVATDHRRPLRRPAFVIFSHRAR